MIGPITSSLLGSLGLKAEWDATRGELTLLDRRRREMVAQERAMMMQALAQESALMQAIGAPHRYPYGYPHGPCPSCGRVCVNGGLGVDCADCQVARPRQKPWRRLRDWLLEEAPPYWPFHRLVAWLTSP